MQQVKLVGHPRQTRGKGPARQARMKGMIPAVLYGGGQEPQMLELNTREFEKLLHGAGESVIFALSIEGAAGKSDTPAILRDLQRHPVTERLVHADLQRIDLSKPIEMEIALHGVGTPIGVKDGGLLEVHSRTLTVLCLPLDAPARIDVTLTELKITDAIYARDLKLDEKLKLAMEPDALLFVVHPPKEEVIEAPVAAEEGAPAEPELITKGKKEEEGEEGAEEGGKEAAAAPGKKDAAKKEPAKKEPAAKEAAPKEDKKKGKGKGKE